MFAILPALTFVVAVLYFHHRRGADELRGIWAKQLVTVYGFDGKGQGILILPLRSYPFRYILREDELSIDFSDDSLTDAVYSIEAEKGTLTLTGADGEVCAFSRQK